MTDLRRGPTVTGGALIDAQDPTTWPSPGYDPAARCLVCADARLDQLTRVNLTPPDLAAAGLPAGSPAVLCLPHLEAAMRRVGSPKPTGNQPTCIACPANDPARFGVTAAWPRASGHHESQPSIRACARHLADAVAALIQENPA